MEESGAVLAAMSILVGYRRKRAVHEPKPGGADRFWGELAIQDWIALAYLLVLLGCSIAGEGPRRAAAIGYTALDLTVFFGALVAVRGGFVTGTTAALLYRGALFVAIFGSFSHLQYILPTARQAVVDGELYAIDRALVGFEPAELMARWVTRATTEWFAFFYFGYFFLLVAHIGPFMASRRIGLLAEFSLGIVLVFAIGHLLYIAVPGHGPYMYLADRFERPLDGGFWWSLVKSTVDSVEESARTDIFPSLHTAAPTYLALFSVRHRREAPFRYTWLPLCLFTSQVVLSTMFLRWHYLIDVIAGLALAASMSVLAHRLAARETARRLAAGKSPVWMPVGRPDTGVLEPIVKT
jgi:hypothetical protein